MAHLKLITTGMIGEQELLTQQRLAARNVATFSHMIAQAKADSLENAIIDVLANAPWTLHLDQPFTAEELRTTPHTESRDYAYARTLLSLFLDRARQHATDGHDDCIILGREYGFTLVPMQPAYREEIRRMAELTALVTAHAHIYEIHFSGGARLTLKAPPADTDNG